MKVMLTGGAGFIGSHIAHLFVSEGVELAVIDNLSTGRRENIPEGVIFFKEDITASNLSDIFKQFSPDVVVHNAAQVSVGASVNNPFRDMETNIRGTLNLLEASVKTGVKRFVFASTGGAIYGEQDCFPADENHCLKPLSPYGVSKLACEKYIYCYYKNYGLSYLVLRYSNVYGPRQDPFGEAGVVAIFTLRMLQGHQPVINGSGEQTRDFVFAGDVARANLMAVKSRETGEVNISTGKEVTINRVFSSLNKLTGADVKKNHGPAVKGEQFRSVLSWKKAFEILGWSPSVAIEDGLKQTVDYFSKKEHI